LDFGSAEDCRHSLKSPDADEGGEVDHEDLWTGGEEEADDPSEVVKPAENLSPQTPPSLTQ